MDLVDARSCFPGTYNRAFLDAAGVSLMPIQAAEALHRLGQDLLLCPARDAASHHTALDRSADRPRRELARLLNARPEEIALVESTTDALRAVAAAVPLGPGDKVLLGATEFLGLAVPWVGRRPAQGFQLEVVPHRDGRLLAEDFARAADDRTRLILLSSVQWSNGFRVDLASFSELARQRGLVLVADAVQHLGALRLDVQQTPADFIVCGGHKWLNAPAGRGFLYAHPRWHGRGAPARGYLHIEQPAEGWAAHFATPSLRAVRDDEFVSDAGQLELGGTSNYPGNAVLGAAVALINEVGPEAIETHVLALGDRLIEAVRRAGATVVSPTGRAERSGIVTFTLGEGPERDRAALERLWEARVVVSQRYTAGVGGLRASVHLYNNDDDVARLADAVRRELHGG